MATLYGNITNTYLNRDTFAEWQRAKPNAGLADSDIAGMTGTLNGFIAMIQAKTPVHITQASWLQNDFPALMRIWGAMIDAVNGAGTTDSLILAAKTTGTQAAMDSMFMTLDPNLTLQSATANSQTLIFTR